jgi:hypothetical protein
MPYDGWLRKRTVKEYWLYVKQYPLTVAATHSGKGGR